MRKSVIYLTVFLSSLIISSNAPGNEDFLLPSHSGSDYDENFDVVYYGLDLNISDSSTYLQGSVSIHIFLLDQSSTRVAFDMSDSLSADSVRINNDPAGFSHTGNRISIDLPVLAMPGALLEVDIFYHGLGNNTGPVTGIYNKNNTAWDKRITWTLSEPFAAMNWFPCKQSLTDKADSVYVFLSTDKRLKAGSNGKLTASVSLPGDRVRYEWKCRYPIDYYLISFAVGDYMDYSFYARLDGGNDSVLIQNYIYNDSSYLEQNKSNIDKTGDMINLFASLFGEYPYASEKYGHCVAPLGGGMEHQTMTTLANFSFSLVAHELAHQWFGDLVTCKTWQDIWINEGFASYADYLATRYLVSQSAADNWIIRAQEVTKALSTGSTYVPDAFVNDVDRIFDSRLSYSKGAAIIHMIRQEVGNDELFFTILREFLRRFKNGNASGLDFRDLLNEMTAKSFDLFFEQWYFGEGYPDLEMNWSHKNDTLYISSLQTTNSTLQVFDLLLEFRVTFENKDTIISHRQNAAFDSWGIYLPGEITGIQVDPNHWLIMNVSGMSQSAGLKRESRFLVLPNPARDKITVRFAEPVESYILYIADSSGKVLVTEESKLQRKTIDIEHFPKGIYFIIIREKNMIYPVKFIKN